MESEEGIAFLLGGGSGDLQFVFSLAYGFLIYFGGSGNSGGKTGRAVRYCKVGR